MDYKSKYLKYKSKYLNLKNKYYNLSKKNLLDFTFSSTKFGDHNNMSNILKYNTELINNLFYPVDDGINDNPKYYKLEFGMPQIISRFPNSKAPTSLDSKLFSSLLSIVTIKFGKQDKSILVVHVYGTHEIIPFVRLSCKCVTEIP